MLGLALLGAVWAVRRRAWLVIAFGAQHCVTVAAFLRFTDGGPFYSIRLLPFLQLGRWMLAGVGFAWLVKGVVTRLRTNRELGIDPRSRPCCGCSPPCW